MIRCIRYRVFAGSLGLAALFAPGFWLAADEPVSAPQTEVRYNRDIRPILSNRCFKCHGPDLKKGGLNLQVRDTAVKELRSGRFAIVPGKGGESELIRRILADDPAERMPPKSPPLPAEQIAKLRAWIDQGAKYEEHWAYVKPVRPALPSVKDVSWPHNGIDYFVLARLEHEGLSPSPEADRATLIRRVSLDLTGLPPTLEEVDAFLADQSPNAYEKVVDRLLNSVHYGEHQARPWLDMARYADTNGYEKDERRTIWPYRDWVINAFNRDMPFDQFTIEQFAGDLLPNATQDQKVATGFHRNTMVNTEGGTDDEEFRVAALVDRVNTTMEVWMGTTMGCCQCHNHKFDPFSQKEFYQLLAFFNGTADQGRSNEPSMPVYTPEQAAKQKLIQAEIARLTAALDAQTPQLAEAQAKWEQSVASSAAWQTLEPDSMISANGAALVKRPDASISVRGATPDTDSYTVTFKTDLKGITGLRLEVLPDKSLSKNGPGRSDNGNFVLNRLHVTTAPAKEPAKAEAVKLQNPSADYSQNEYAIAGAIDDDPKTGWAVHPEVGKAHTAVFETAQDIGFDGGTVLTVTLDQSYGFKHTLGRFRLSVTTSPRPVKLPQLPDNVTKLLAIKPDQRDDKQKAELARHYRSIAPEFAAQREQLAKLRQEETKIKPATTLVMRELDKPRQTFVHIRGNHTKKGDAVSPGVPAKLHPLHKGLGSPLTRLDLARWLVDPDNPLVGRVIMNRMWARYFGKGFVETSEDFGIQGDLPTHPELLDWLAVEFVGPLTLPSPPAGGEGRVRGWSLKAMHKLIVMSATYRQSSRVSPAVYERDPFNRLFARGPRFRLDAEMVRDNALAISGLLNHKVGGPSVFPYQPDGVWFNPYSADKWVTSSNGDQHRRGLYTFWRRTAPYAAFIAFDAPSREVACERRPRTNTPLQALATLNDKAFVECAAALARRMMTEAKGDRDRAIHGFRLCVARAPTAQELDHLLALYQQNLAKYRNDPAAVKAMATNGNAVKDVDLRELAAWTVVANVLLNLDETITKG
jgi:mono/diheme cytochrome c family protein